MRRLRRRSHLSNAWATGGDTNCISADEPSPCVELLADQPPGRRVTVATSREHAHRSASLLVAMKCHEAALRPRDEAVVA